MSFSNIHPEKNMLDHTATKGGWENYVRSGPVTGPTWNTYPYHLNESWYKDFHDRDMRLVLYVYTYTDTAWWTVYVISSFSGTQDHIAFNLYPLTLFHLLYIMIFWFVIGYWLHLSLFANGVHLKEWIYSCDCCGLLLSLHTILDLIITVSKLTWIEFIHTSNCICD